MQESRVAEDTIMWRTYVVVYTVEAEGLTLSSGTHVAPLKYQKAQLKLATLTWQGAGSINATITSPAQSYTEDTIPVYQKTTYTTTSDQSGMLNIKRLSISVTALPADQSWTIALTFDSVTAYQIAVEVQK
jgi:hypothetical protein